MSHFCTNAKQTVYLGHPPTSSTSIGAPRTLTLSGHPRRSRHPKVTHTATWLGHPNSSRDLGHPAPPRSLLGHRSESSEVRRQRGWGATPLDVPYGTHNVHNILASHGNAGWDTLAERTRRVTLEHWGFPCTHTSDQPSQRGWDTHNANTILASPRGTLPTPRRTVGHLGHPQCSRDPEHFFHP